MFDYRFDENGVLFELRLDQSSPEIQEKVIDGIYAQLYERMRIRVIDSLSDADLDEFEQLSDEAANDWLTNHFPDSNDMFEEELHALVDEMKSFVDSAESGARELNHEADKE